jgi:hypothetical protein
MSTDRLADRRGPVAHHPAPALRDYDRLKMELAGIIRSVKQLAADRKDKEKSEECRSLLVRLAEDRFNLAVVGQFSRGKTSLMNALLGMDRLPVGVLPLTSVVTTVYHGDHERVLVQCKGWSLPHEVPLGELARHVTQAGNPGNEALTIHQVLDPRVTW